MDTRLHAALHARALHDDVEPLCELVSRPREDLIRCLLGLLERLGRAGRQPLLAGHDVPRLGKAFALGKLDALLRDVDDADAARAEGLGGFACEQADCAAAEDEDGLAGRDLCATGAVQGDAERLDE